jgi:hypothetical protein
LRVLAGRPWRRGGRILPAWTGWEKVANEFYSYGVSDEVKNLYWTQRRLQEPGYDNQRPPLQRKYVTVWVPEQKQPDGTVTEGHYKVVEVVE